jgi:hypothetical protein
MVTHLNIASIIMWSTVLVGAIWFIIQWNMDMTFKWVVIISGLLVAIGFMGKR